MQSIRLPQKYKDTTEYQLNITIALNLYQTVFPTFLAFAAEGGFIVPHSSLQYQDPGSDSS